MSSASHLPSPVVYALDLAISFFVYYTGPHPALHSFPTRRSSDLMVPASTVQPALALLAERGVPAWNAGSITAGTGEDRKSTRLNSSHVAISYAVFCLKNKNNKI